MDMQKKKAADRKNLFVIFSSVRFLGRQSLALRGHFIIYDDKEKGEIDSNFMQLLILSVEENSMILKWLKNTHNKYTSLEIKKEDSGNKESEGNQ